MSSVLMPKRPSAPEYLRGQSRNPLLPAWQRVGLWMLGHLDQHGHARAWPGEIRQDLGLSAKALSNAIEQARSRGWIDPCSTAGCLVLPGQALAPCEAQHRGAS